MGDAAHAVHPLAGQGANLGLLDAAALVQTIAEAVQRGEDIGDPGPVGRYARWRRAEAAPLTLGLHALQQAFSSPQGWLGSLRRQGLGVVAGNRWLRRQFMTRAMGLGGEAPRLCLVKTIRSSQGAVVKHSVKEQWAMMRRYSTDMSPLATSFHFQHYST